MRRRNFITLSGSAVTTRPMIASAQQATVPTIGILMATAADDLESQARLQAFLQGLRAAGWVEGRNMRVETRWIDGDPETSPNLRRRTCPPQTRCDFGKYSNGAAATEANRHLDLHRVCIGL